MKVINKGGTDKVVIMGVRQGLIQPFEATDWLDLRVGYYLSICGDADPSEDDTITGLTQDIGTDPTLLGVEDRYFIGIKDRGLGMPHSAGSVYIGFSNEGVESRVPTLGASRLLSSDSGIGTTNSNYWRPANGIDASNLRNFMVFDGTVTRGSCHDGVQPHFAQANIGGAGPAGYASLLMFRLQRNTPDPEAVITVTTKTGTHSGVVEYSSTPTLVALQTNLESFPTTIQTIGPVFLSAVPDAFFIYWPWTNSRIRLHAMGFLKIR